jgi:hypothetical protein
VAWLVQTEVDALALQFFDRGVDVGAHQGQLELRASVGRVSRSCCMVHLNHSASRPAE